MILKRLQRGIAAMNDPLPGPSDKGSLSGQWVTLGHIPLVPALGRVREATYRDIYLTNPWVWAAVNKQASSVGRLPLHTYELDERGRKRRVRGDVGGRGRPSAGANLDRLLSAPVDGISRNAMIGATVRDRRIYGNALWEIERGPGSFPTGLRRIRWRDVVRVREDDLGNVTAYVVKSGDGFHKTRALLPADVIHFGLGSDSEGPCGVSPLQACRNTLALHDVLVRHLIHYFANAMRPSGHISVEKLNEKQRKEIREAIEELYATPENAGKVLVTSGKWEGISDTLEHAQIIELMKGSREEVAAAYEIPPPVLGILDHAIKSNVKELREQYGRDSVGPLASDFEADIMAQLVLPQPAWRSLFVRFQLAEFLRPDLEARAMVYQRLKHIFSIDEIRAFEDVEPFDKEGVTDIPWIDSGAMPLTTAAQQEPRRRREA